MSIESRAAPRSRAEMLKSAEKKQARGRTPQPIALTFKYSELKATPWVARGFALRQAVTYLAASGGTGKTQFTLQAATAFALGEDFAGFHPMRPLKVSFVSGEEPYDELQRRVAAILIDRVGRANEAEVDALMQKLDGKLFTFAGKSVAIVNRELDESIERTTFHKELCEHTKANGIDLVILDPIARLHSGLDENSSEMQELHNAADELATQGNCGVVLVHHIRKSSKGSVDDQHAARGASAMTDAARIVVMMANMTRDEAKVYLPTEKQEEFVRYCKLAGPKQSYGVNSAAIWFHKTTVQLPVLLEDNSPDCRFVLTPWKPDQSNNVLNAKWLSEFFDKIEAGLGDGEFYHVTPMGPRPIRADALLEDQFDVPKKSSRNTLKLLVDAGMLGVTEKMSPKAKRNIKVYVVLRRQPIDFNESYSDE